MWRSLGQLVLAGLPSMRKGGRRWGTVAAVLGFPGQSLLCGRGTLVAKQSPSPDTMSFAAGDSVCHASLPQPLQRPGQRGLPAG